MMPLISFHHSRQIYYVKLMLLLENDYLQIDSDVFILFAERKQILLKISFIFILLTLSEN